MDGVQPILLEDLMQKLLEQSRIRFILSSGPCTQGTAAILMFSVLVSFNARSAQFVELFWKVFFPVT